jgi:hypothetical protein
MSEIRTFDVHRAVFDDYLDYTIFPARLELDISDMQPLNDALANQSIPLDTHLLGFEAKGSVYVFPMALVLAYNVIHGQFPDGSSWVMTFCNACNTGVVFNPILDGQMLRFSRRGSYDGLLMIWDQETGSYWQHITGECLYGPSAGKQLELITTTNQMRASEATTAANPVYLLTSALTPVQEKLSRAMERMRANPETVTEGIFKQIVSEDERRPRFELGLGVWNTETQRSSFYPLGLIYAHNNALLTEFAGRLLLVYQKPEALSPTAVFTDTREAIWEGDVLRLDQGATIRNDLYQGTGGQRVLLERPRQLLMRWYGFSLTFPNCDLPKAREDV